MDFRQIVRLSYHIIWFILRLQNFDFSRKSILGQNFAFRSIYRFSSKIAIIEKGFSFSTKISIFMIFDKILKFLAQWNKYNNTSSIELPRSNFSFLHQVRLRIYYHKFFDLQFLRIFAIINYVFFRSRHVFRIWKKVVYIILNIFLLFRIIFCSKTWW